jgi:RNA polymerase sigma-B factor
VTVSAPPLDAARRERRDALLFDRYRRTRDPRVREELVQRFLPLARSLAGRYQRSNEPFDDLIQVASLGLVKAIDRFDPDNGASFSSYAVPTILGELKRHFRDRTWSVRVPRGLQESSMKVDKEVERLRTQLGRGPTVQELSAGTGLSEEDVLEALQAGDAHSATSLETPRSREEEEGTLADTLGADDDGFALAEDRATLASLLTILSDRDLEVLRLRFEEDMSQAQIGEIIGVSQMQVSRILRRAVAALRAESRGLSIAHV